MQNLEIGDKVSVLDDDFDGVQNDADQCPNTQIGSEVNDFGCSQNQLDDDKDGVVNDSDHCSKTVFGDVVNDFGCSRNELEDDDYDGVLNYLDSCPDTRKNVFYVDDNGCELLGLNEQEQTQIQLYPNPVANYVLVPLSTNKDVLELYNSVGTKQVLNITEQNGELNIDTSALEQGLYLLKVNGRVYRFVKE